MRSTLDDLLFTLRICQEELPADVHPDHIERLLAIEKIVRWFFDDEERREKEERKRWLRQTKDEGSHNSQDACGTQNIVAGAKNGDD